MGEDFPGRWEYVYDVVASTDAGGVNYSWCRYTYLRGFDGTLIANVWDDAGNLQSPAVGNTLKQNWTAEAAGIARSFLPYTYPERWPSNWVDGAWELPDTTLPSAAWGMTNSYHPGTDYLRGDSVWQVGETMNDGLRWENTNGFVSFQGLTGLLQTFRIVHPDGPGQIEWGTFHNYTLGDAMEVVGTTIGPVPEPATLGMLTLGGLALLKRRK
ncbi:MAG: PEP-CTERM sorting domain-containing protein [Planctomycetota bacterium]